MPPQNATCRLINYVFLVQLLLFLLQVDGRITVTSPTVPSQSFGGSGNGVNCVVCTFIVGVISQLRQLHHISARDAANLYCSFMPPTYKIICNAAGAFALRGAFDLIDENRSADVICRALLYCSSEKCHLFPRENKSSESVVELRKRYGWVSVPPVSIFDHLGSIYDLRALRPDDDDDGDFFSTTTTSGGSYWRGRDCNDSDATVFPGRDSIDSERDENCNGVFGVDPKTGRTYEELWCSDSQPMGVIVVGDSASAHFGIPADLVTVFEMSSRGYANIESIVRNSVDWPMLSSFTGFRNTTEFEPNRNGPMISVYSQLVERNRCNHRDFQNLGQNGATSGSVSHILRHVARNRNASVKPAYLFISMVGNDVCLPPPHVMPPETYYNNIVTSLSQADAFLPPGSHVLLVPLADGRILYDSMHNRTHPIGSLHNDVTYANLYDFLACLDVNPCWGWLNTNETVRNITWERAANLNKKLSQIVTESQNKYQNFKVHLFDDVMAAAVKQFSGPVWELVEPVDGFHPSQLASALVGKYMFSAMEKMGILPPENPHNGDIMRLFGNQGGY
uniref:Putative GPI inositol deacylase n=1 Tax=Trypanosoma vivax (strain Y486) TaxID=1055687 RepID=G0U6C8_TRYVY|nr:putative GPI inositol deacylase precursor [Trypanosoma vivax Y486]